MTGEDGDGSEPFTAELDALAEAYRLKDEVRTGWQLRGVSDPETVAAHTWGVCLLCLAFADRAPGVDADAALRMAVVHDLGEARTGDIPTRADPGAETPPAEEVERRERAAVADLARGLGAPTREGGEENRSAPTPDDPLRAVWERYEAREGPTARFVKDMDLVDMCVQALWYEREARYDPTEERPVEAYDRLDEFFATAEPRLSTDVGRRLFAATRERYEVARDSR